MRNIAAVRQYLGGAKAIGSPESDLDFVGTIRDGFPVSVLETLSARTKLSEDTIVQSLGIARRTAARRKRQGGRLKPIESELLLRLARVLAAATDVLGSEEKARGWIVAENRALGGHEPIRLLDTGLGFQDVMDVLGRVEYGVYS
jgi:putative toxin-antitoxin system antitoxin component (TIGR02293 family)